MVEVVVDVQHVVQVLGVVVLDVLEQLDLVKALLDIHTYIERGTGAGSARNAASPPRHVTMTMAARTRTRTRTRTDHGRTDHGCGYTYAYTYAYTYLVEEVLVVLDDLDAHELARVEIDALHRLRKGRATEVLAHLVSSVAQGKCAWP